MEGFLRENVAEKKTGFIGKNTGSCCELQIANCKLRIFFIHHLFQSQHRRGRQVDLICYHELKKTHKVAKRPSIRMTCRCNRMRRQL